MFEKRKQLRKEVAELQEQKLKLDIEVRGLQMRGAKERRHLEKLNDDVKFEQNLIKMYREEVEKLKEEKRKVAAMTTVDYLAQLLKKLEG